MQKSVGTGGICGREVTEPAPDDATRSPYWRNDDNTMDKPQTLLLSGRSLYYCRASVVLLTESEANPLRVHTYVRTRFLIIIVRSRYNHLSASREIKKRAWYAYRALFISLDSVQDINRRSCRNVSCRPLRRANATGRARSWPSLEGRRGSTRHLRVPHAASGRCRP